MKAIDKIRGYLKSISHSEEHYNWLLGKVWINPKFRDEPCSHPECSCSECPINFLHRRQADGSEIKH